MSTISELTTASLSEYIKLAGMIALLVGASSTSAASFSCKKAKTKVESTICVDPTLSQLDSQLSAHYKEALTRTKDAKTLASAQKKWIIERDACADNPCMADSYRRRNAELRSQISLFVAACSVDEKSLLGSWARKGAGDFEEFSLSIDGTRRAFISWLHHRPELVANWQIKDCTLDVDNPDNPAIGYSYKLRSATEKVLILESVEDMGRVYTYIRKR